MTSASLSSFLPPHTHTHTISVRCLVYDLVHTFVPHLSTQSLNELFDFVSPRLDVGACVPTGIDMCNVALLRNCVQKFPSAASFPLLSSYFLPSLSPLRLSLPPSLPPLSPSPPSLPPLPPSLPQCANKLIQKKAYNVLEHILATNSSTHQSFRKKHLDQLKVTLLESLSTAHPAAKKVQPPHHSLYKF